MQFIIRFAAHLRYFLPLLFLLLALPVTAAANEDERAEKLFQQFFDETLARSPMKQTYLGLKTNYGQWDDLSADYQQQTDQLLRNQLQGLYQLDIKKLSPENRFNYYLMEATLKQRIDQYTWRHYLYPVNQMFGTHTEIASLLMNSHKIDGVTDAHAYIQRIKGVNTLLHQVVDQLKENAQAGIVPPGFVFPLVISSCENLLQGQPFNGQEDSPILGNFRTKITALNLPSQEQQALLQQASHALQHSFEPGYRHLIRYVKELEQQADTRDGVWKFPKGKDYYRFALAFNTTTDLSADEIHAFGLAEVERIHGEIRRIMQQLKFTGSVQDFFRFMRDDPRFYFPNTDAGRAAYLSEATRIIDEMREHLDELFISQPKAQLLVSRVEPFREKTAGKAFYRRPAAKGTRPGVYYANLYNMRAMPIYQMQALAYHEGIPGHHMQIAIAQEKTDLPVFRQHVRYIAFVEGWALYAELLPLELGLYKDAYAEFGRLALELWRASRLVVDTGIHAQRWSREKAIHYLLENTPNTRQDIVKSVQRYIVMPGQATAYTLGMKKIFALREYARTELGTAFDLRLFHEQVLQGGAMPLTLLEDHIKDWVSTTKAQRKPE